MLSKPIYTYQSKIGVRESSLLYDEQIERTLAVLDNINTSAEGVLTNFSVPSELRSIGKVRSIVEHDVDEGIERNTKELCELNDQFAHYIERVHYLEAENKSFTLELECVEKNAITYNKMVQNMIEQEINGILQMIEHIQSSRVQINKEIADKENAKDQYHKIASNYQDDEYIRQLQNRIEECVNAIAKNECTCTLLKRRSADIDDKINNCKVQIDKLNDKLALTVHMGQQEKARNCQFQEKKSELNGILKLRKRQYTENLRNVNKNSFHRFRSNIFIDGNLSKLIKDMRDDHERNIDKRKKELKQKFQSDYQDLLQRRNQMRKPYRLGGKQLLTSNNKIDSFVDHFGEIKLQMKIHELQREVSELTANNIALHDTLQKLNQTILNEQQEDDKLYTCKQSELQTLKKKLQNVTKHCKQIIETNSTIDEEVQNYRCLLEGSDLVDTGLKHFADNVEDRLKSGNI